MNVIGAPARITPLSSARSHSSFASLYFSASGFSQNTCLPASSAFLHVA